jgi:surface protein
MSITDANFTYAVVSAADRTLAITGINPANATYSASNANWGTFPAIASVYAGSNTAYNGNGVPANAFKVVEIGANAFDSLTAFADTTVTAGFLPANLNRIGERAFAGVKLSGTLTVPATMEAVGFQAFHSTLITDIIIGSSTNSGIVAHLADLTSVINQEITDRTAADASLDLLKAPIQAPAFTGTAAIPSAAIGLATISSASVTAASINVATVASASLSTAIIGNAAFAGSVSATGQWNFTTQPQYNSHVLATEPFLTSTIAAISNFTSSMDTLASLKTEMGPDTAFATKIFNSHVSISTALSTETSLRSSAVSSLSSALSASVSSLAVVDAGLQSTLLAETSTRVTNVSSLSGTLSAAVSSLAVVDAGVQDARLTETSTRIANVSYLTSVLSASVSSLAVVDAGVQDARLAETSTRIVAVASVASLTTASVAALDAADVALNAALNAETIARGSALSAIVPLQSAAFAATNSAHSAALASEINSRVTAIASLSQSVSAASNAAHAATAQYSIALAHEVAGRSAAISAISSSAGASITAFVSAGTSLTDALSAEALARTSAVSSASASINATNAAAGAANASVAAQLTAETSVRTSQIASISSATSVAVSSLVVGNSLVSLGLANEVAARSSAISAAIATVLSGAPSRMNTLEKIASEIQTNPLVTLTSSVINRVSSLSAAVSNEIATRISAVASLSSTAVPSLSAVDAGLISALSTETSSRVSAVASLSSTLSSASVSFSDADGALNGALLPETMQRTSAILSVSTAVATVVANLTATDATLGATLSTEIANRQSGIVSLAAAMALSVASLNDTKTALSTALSAEVSTRVASVASVSGAVAATYASLQSAESALRTNVTALSSALALKATASYLDGKTSALLNGTPDNLNTLVEIAAALGNNPSFASSITTALSARANVADAFALSVAIASKATLSELTTVVTAASSKATAASINAANTSMTALTNTAASLSLIVSTLTATGGTVNANSLQVSGVTIPVLATRIQELYHYYGTANPSWGAIKSDGTINYKLNRLANPTLVSSVLGFEYAAGGAINKVSHIITVQFDKDQKSVTVTGGPGNPTTTVNNLVLDASNRRMFTIAYAGNLAFYEANKTAVSIVALDTPYKLAPAAPTVTAPAPLLSSLLSLEANGTTVKYVGNVADVPTSEPLIFQANIRGTTEWFAVVKQDMKAAISSYASGTDGPFKPLGQSVAVPFNNIVTTLMTDMNNLFNGKSGFNSPIASWDTGNVINMAYLFANTPTNGFNQPIDKWNTSNVTNMDSMFYYSGLFNKAIGSWNTAAVTNMGGMFFNATAFNQPIGTWNTGAVTNMNYMFYGASAFNQNISGWNVAAVSPNPPTSFINTANSALKAQNNPFGVVFAAPTLSGITYLGNTASITYNVAFGISHVQVRKASDGTVIYTTNVSGFNVTFSLSFTENVSIVVVALANDNGRESAASAQQALLVKYAAPTISAGGITHSGNTASMTYNVASGVTAVQVRKASDNTVITSGVTISVNTSNQTASVSITFSSTLNFVVVAIGNSNGRESLPSIAQTLIGQYAAPTLSNSVTYSGKSASMTYSVDLGVSALTVLKSDLTALPADVVVSTTINNGSFGRTMSLSVAFTTSMTIVVIAQGNANGSQSAASAPVALVGNFAKPTLSGSITYSGNTASMTYAVASGVTAVSVLQPNLSALPSGATVTTNTVSGNTATLQISLSDSLSFVVVAQGNANGRQSDASDKQTISSGISDITFTKSSNLWYFGFNCNDPASVSGLSINIQWSGRVLLTGYPARGSFGTIDWVHDYSSFTISTGANSFLITDPGYLDLMMTGNKANVYINYAVSGVSKYIATSFIPKPLTGGPYVLGISNINTNINPGTCTLTIPAALEQQRVSQNRTWIYFADLIDAITNVVVVSTYFYSSQGLLSGVFLNLPSPSWGKQLKHRLSISNSGESYSGDYAVQTQFTSNDIFTIPLPTEMFQVSVRGEDFTSIGMQWQTPFVINDIRLWGVAWDVFPSALDVASPNYVSKVRIRMKRSTDSTWRFTDVYNYADGIGYAMFHTGVYTQQGQALGEWTTEIRSENADGTITTNYSTYVRGYGLASYDPGIHNLTQLASKAGGFNISYGDNVTNLF